MTILGSPHALDTPRGHIAQYVRYVYHGANIRETAMPALKLLYRTLLVCLLGSLAAVASAQPAELKLYIFQNGFITGMDPALFNFTRDEIKEPDFIVTSNLIVHPNGILMWESGAEPDADFPTDGSPLVNPPVRAEMTLTSQLAALGLSPAEIDYFAMSHLHSDHTGNANLFAGAHWIVQKADRDAMFAGQAQGPLATDTFDQLQNAETTILDNADYDVFGDGSVMIISAPGHTPGHQVLLVNLPETGPVLLAGDLYHYPEEMTLNRFPAFEYDTAQSGRSRENPRTGPLARPIHERAHRRPGGRTRPPRP